MVSISSIRIIMARPIIIIIISTLASIVFFNLISLCSIYTHRPASLEGKHAFSRRMSEFVLLGAREKVEEDRSKELVKESLAALNENGGIEKCNKIRLSNKSFSEEAARVISEALASLKEVVHADLSDIIAGRHESEALKVLEIVCQGLVGRKLKTIDVSDNALGEKGINACRSILENQEGLEQFYVCNNGLSAAAARAVVEILTFRTPTKLKTMHFFNNMSGDGGAEALAGLLPHCTLLEDLRFSGTRAGPAGSLVFAKAMNAQAGAGVLKNLVKIDLADNSFGGEAAKLLGQALQCQSKLVELNLRDCSLEDAGALAILGALSTGKTPLLKHLDLAGNEVTWEGIPTLNKAMKKLSQLTYLSLEENEIGSKGARRLAKGLSTQCLHLSTLKLNQNEITRGGAVALVTALCSRVQGEGATILKKLELDANYISEGGVKEIEVLMEEKGVLEALGSMEENEWDEDEEDEDEEGDEEEEKDEEEEEEEGGAGEEEEVDDLAAAVSKVSI